MRSFWVRAALCAVLVGITLALARLVGHVVGGTTVVGELLLPVTLAAYLCGRNCGILTTVLAVGAAALLLGNAWHVDEASAIQRVAFLGINGLVISTLTGWLHAARRRSVEAAKAETASQQRLATSKRHFAIAFDASPLPSAIIRSVDLQIIAANNAAVGWLGVPREQLLASTLHDLGIARDELRRVIGELDECGQVMRSRVSVERKGERRTVSVFGERMILDDQSHTFVVFDDITEREHAEQARRESEARFAAAFDACPLPYAMMRMRDRTFVAANDAFLAFFGYSRDEVVGRQSDELDLYGDPIERDLARTMMARERRINDLSLSLRRRDGTVRMALASVETLTIDGVEYGVSVFADVTEKEQAERELRSTQALFEKVFSTSPLPRSIVRASDMAYVDVNAAYVEMFGYTREELIGRHVTDFPFFVEAQADVMARAERMKHESMRSVPLRLRTKSGSVLETLFSCEPFEIHGELLLTATIQDVTSRARAEEALRESEERFAKAFDGNPLPSAIARVRDRVFLAANDQWLATFGYTHDEVVGKCAADVALYANEADGARVRELVARDGFARDVDLKFVRRDGSELDVIWSVQTIDIGGEPYYLGTLQDITERKRAEEALRESEARFRQLAENIREVFWLYDAAEKRVIYVSPAYETIWGRTYESIAADPDDWLRSIHPDDRERVARTRRREDYDQQYRIVRPDGSVRWIHDRAFPVRNQSGRIVRIAGLAEDVTQRRTLEEQLRQTQKMESLGLLAGGVAHDFNNLLAVISSSNGMLAESLPAAGEQRELVQEIDAAVQRATGLTRQLLAFSRKQVVEPKVLDINAAVQETRKMLRRMVGEDVMLQTSLDSEIGHVKVDPGYLVQVLMNLAVNARDAMPRGGTLEIATRQCTITECQARAHPGVTEGPAVQLSVTDTGCGIPPEILGHIFEPFFTTKEQGKGTGMGLAVVHGIVDQAGGFIEVESELGKGTTFNVVFPIVEGDVARQQDVVNALAFGAERILFVDDDEYVRRSAARALRARGYTVIEAADGQAALSQLQQRVDLLLTDVVMPRMDGRQLAEAARSKYPGLKVLYTSGYTDDAIVRHGVADGNFDLIEKPFRVQALATRIRQVLDR